VGNALEIALGIVAGGLINWLFSRQASKELRQEAEELRQLIHLILRAMHNSELAEIIYNEHGKPVGMVVKGSGAISGEGSISADPTVRRDEEPD
jgi:hypothetical protein